MIRFISRIYHNVLLFFAAFTQSDEIASYTRAYGVTLPSPPFRQFPTVFHISSIFLPTDLTKLVSFPEVFQDENV
ncbi:hypothetical protein ABR35_00235 [Enterobacter cloacae subsp. cloacae]|uniref:Uncharacterized protein n=1 Tax=Enterobacter cloacae subsp. cloacae TaxID=336306 RepID=A0AAE2EC89_ENTCL|nr:hypothetical protein SS44_13505 [Enterobacter cloacae subsp. cloacae]KLQ18389.1 hypothetical protein ABR35_00235 [Enterobacter cloacae subsp. cloacae]